MKRDTKKRINETDKESPGQPTGAQGAEPGMEPRTVPKSKRGRKGEGDAQQESRGQEEGRPPTESEPTGDEAGADAQVQLTSAHPGGPAMEGSTALSGSEQAVGEEQQVAGENEHGEVQEVKKAVYPGTEGTGRPALPRAEHDREDPPPAVMIDTDKIIGSGFGEQAPNLQDLIESIPEVGLLNPLTVRWDPETGQFYLVAGRRRREACKLLGLNPIPCRVLSVDKLTAELAAIDENLVRRELAVLERCEQLKRRKEIYEALHPEAVRPQGGRRPKNDEIISPFSEDTAEKGGVSQRTVQQEVQIAEKLSEETKRLIRGTEVEDRKADLLRLAKLPPEEQLQTATKLVEGKVVTPTQGSKRRGTQGKKHKPATESRTGTRAGAESRGATPGSEDAQEAGGANGTSATRTEPSGLGTSQIALDASQDEGPALADHTTPSTPENPVKSAWDEAGEGARRTFLESLREDPETAALLRRVLGRGMANGPEITATADSFLNAWKKLKEEVHRRAALERLLAEPRVAELLAEIQSELAEEGQERQGLEDEEEGGDPNPEDPDEQEED